MNSGTLIIGLIVCGVLVYKVFETSCEVYKASVEVEESIALSVSRFIMTPLGMLASLAVFAGLIKYGYPHMGVVVCLITTLIVSGLLLKIQVMIMGPLLDSPEEREQRINRMVNPKD